MQKTGQGVGQITEKSGGSFVRAAVFAPWKEKISKRA